MYFLMCSAELVTVIPSSFPVLSKTLKPHLDATTSTSVHLHDSLADLQGVGVEVLTENLISDVMLSDEVAQ